ncbi:MAG: hypothetical protein ACOVSW_00590 [Candidatus Kapaibacteriota bacterium]
MLEQQLSHPYTRYGFAVAAWIAEKNPEELFSDEELLRKTLIEQIENELEHFRYQTANDPRVDAVLVFEPIHFSTLKADAKLVQSAGLASQGRFLAPHLVTTDGDASGTFANAVEMLNLLQKGTSLHSSYELKRSFAPTNSKLNNGKASLSNAKVSLFEAACTLITTLTRHKPAAWIGGSNTAIIPDLELDELRKFLNIFAEISKSETNELMNAKLSKPDAKVETVETGKKKQGTTKKEKTTDDKPKNEFKRPKIFSGNYPDAPSMPEVFGSLGIIAAIGKWAYRATNRSFAAQPLESLTGIPIAELGEDAVATIKNLCGENHRGKPMYVVSYDKISHVQFSYHISRLALDGNLAALLNGIIYDTDLYSQFDNTRQRWDNETYKLFYMMASRFLQCFDSASFQDFLAFRAEYPSIFSPLFEAYFMSNQETKIITIEVVEAARHLGRWINTAAYLTAKEEFKDKNLSKPEKDKKIKQEKGKILTELESSLASAKTSVEMLANVATRVGRLIFSDMPPESHPFLDAAAADQISKEQAQQLLTAFMRVRGAKVPKEAPDDESETPAMAGDEGTIANETL